MEKIKFGIQLTVLMLAFPVWFVTEMKQADRDMKKNHAQKEQVIEIKKIETGQVLQKAAPGNDVTMMPGSKLIIVNI